MLIRCRECRSDNVNYDCSTWWNADTQEWEVGEPYHKSDICGDCGAERCEEEVYLTDDEFIAYKAKRRLTQ